MPREYVAIRDALVDRGKPYDEAQRIAAATYNKRHPGHPVTRASHEEDKADEAAHRAKHANDKKRRLRMPPARKS